MASRIVFIGVGGQGNILASRLIGEAAIKADVPVRLSETHGMAQRGGVVESVAIIGEGMSHIISPGEADVIVSFEPLEALRSLEKANKDTLLITSTAKMPPFTVAIGQGEYPALDDILALLKAKTARVISFDALAEAEAAGNPLGVNMVLLGALIAAADLPIKAEHIQAAIKTTTKAAFVDMNLDCFNRGLSSGPKGRLTISTGPVRPARRGT